VKIARLIAVLFSGHINKLCNNAKSIVFTAVSVYKVYRRKTAREIADLVIAIISFIEIN
jgi:deoxyribose-phosphate aldolase